jgi:hypothetical protein
MTLGLLLATMEPPAGMEEEFQDWYDTEHFPERRDCEGFLTAGRWVCLDGWPRYLALYDLSDAGVLTGPAYSRIAVDRYSPWTHRIMAKMWGQYRMAGEQIYPGAAKLGDRGASARLLLMRFRDAPAHAGDDIVEGLRATLGGEAQAAQFRVFRESRGAVCDFAAIVEARGRIAPPPAMAFGSAATHLDLVNTYAPYSRRAAGAFPGAR